ncbi:MAG: hypothetical protein K2Y02_08305 [Burkholderiaceae bacterium]|nr:hypothetical protein [Burkholderiaceae bacterium]
MFDVAGIVDPGRCAPTDLPRGRSVEVSPGSEVAQPGNMYAETPTIQTAAGTAQHRWNNRLKRKEIMNRLKPLKGLNGLPPVATAAGPDPV